MGEVSFRTRSLEELVEREDDVDRIYTDSVGVPTMGIGTALAVRVGEDASGRNQYALLGKPEIEARVREGTGNPSYAMPASEYALLRRAVALSLPQS